MVETRISIFGILIMIDEFIFSVDEVQLFGKSQWWKYVITKRLKMNFPVSQVLNLVKECIKVFSATMPKPILKKT